MATIFDAGIDRTITLANLAGVDTPETPTSPGAKFLNRVADAVEDAVERAETDERALNEIAEDAPSTGSQGTWQEFVDLKGWREDTTDLTGDRISARKITEHAHTVLVIIAERLIAALIEEHNNDTIDKPKLAALMAEPSLFVEEEK